MTDDTITDIAFTPAVKAMQTTLGSRAQMEVMSRRRGFQTEVTVDLERFLAHQTSFYLATASADGRPYLQHRGGPPGFVEVLDRTTLSLPDYPGNRQYISLGNLAENDRVALIFVDYETKTRIKIWGRARVENLTDKSNRRLLIDLEAWDVNCQQHLPEYYRRETVERLNAKLLERIAALEAEVERLSA